MTDPILEQAREIAAEVLALEPDEVRSSDRLFEGLGGESIDLLDLTFHCEKRFGVKLPIQRLDQGPSTDAQGLLTADSIALLKRELPFLPVSSIEDRPLRSRFRELWTVEAIAEFIRRAAAAQRAGSDSLVQDPPQPT